MWFMLVSYLPYSLTMKMEASCSSEMFVDFQRTTRRHFQKDRIHHIMRIFNLYYFLFFLNFSSSAVTYCHDLGVTTEGVCTESWIYWHNLELQVITAPLLISTIHGSPQHLLSLFQPAVSIPAVPWQRFWQWRFFSLTPSGLLSQPPVQSSTLNWQVSIDWQLTGSSQSQSYVTIDGQSASLSWCQAPIWDLRPDFFFCLTVAGLLKWGALSDDRTGLPFIMKNVKYIYILHVIT
jgi:hypothetical protein